MSDIVERLRDEGRLNRECGALTTAARLDEAADEIERLRSELAAAVKQRDEARREVCRHLSMRSAVLGVHRSSKEHAIERGWDCYKKAGGA